MSTTLKRSRATGAALTVAALAAFALPGQARAAVPVGEESPSAAHFIATTLAANGDHYDYPPSDWGTFPDVGNTIDAILALGATGSGGDQVAASLAWVQSQANGYALEWGASSGGLGKLAIVAAATGSDPTSFGGIDLPAELHGLLAPDPEPSTPQTPGRFGTSDNDYDVTINQALAMLGLHRTTGTIPPESLEYLAAQQCEDGGVRGTLDAEPCVSDPDATAFAAQAFTAAGAGDRAGRALDHLVGLQLADGSLTNASGEGANANTTGVAAQAFAAGGRTEAAGLAATFLRSLQWGCEAADGYRGGIAFTTATMDQTESNLHSAIRATPQALLGLARGSLVTVDATDLAAGTVPMTCPTDEPSVDEPPVDEPPVDEPPVDEPPVGEPPVNEPPAGTPPTVVQPVVTAPTSTPTPATGALAHTGTDPTVPFLLASGLIAAGAVLLIVRQRAACR